MYNTTNLPTSASSGSALTLSADLHWYAIYTRSRFEKKVHRDLKQSKFEAFLPLVSERMTWSDRIKTVHTPLLPSYVFVKLERPQIPQLSYFPGIVRVVSFGGKPCIVRDEEIQLLEQIMTYGFPVRQVAHCDIGDKARIIEGPLKGWEGTIETKKGQSRIVLQIASILQCISVEVGIQAVEKIG